MIHTWFYVLPVTTQELSHLIIVFLDEKTKGTEGLSNRVKVIQGILKQASGSRAGAFNHCTDCLSLP